MDITPLLTLETIGSYLKKKEVNYETETSAPTVSCVPTGNLTWATLP